MFLRDLIFSQYIVDTYINVSYDFFIKNLFIFQLVFNVIFCKYNYALTHSYNQAICLLQTSSI